MITDTEAPYTFGLPVALKEQWTGKGWRTAKPIIDTLGHVHQYVEKDGMVSIPSLQFVIDIPDEDAHGYGRGHLICYLCGETVISRCALPAPQNRVPALVRETDA